MANRDVQAAAEARLVPLIREGIGTIGGISNIAGLETVFIRLNDKPDEDDPDYQSKVDAIRARLRSVLIEIPFEIIGVYDNDLTIDAQHVSNIVPPTIAEAAGASSHVAPSPHIKKDNLLSRPTRTARVEQYSVPNFAVVSEHNIDERLTILEKKTARLPSRTFLVAAILVNFGFIALVILYQPKLVEEANDVLSTLQNQLRSSLLGR